MKCRRVFEPGSSYFLTIVTNGRTPIFAQQHAVHQYQLATQKVQASRPFSVEAEVILPDHIHTLWALPDGDADYPTRMRLIKSFVTRAIASSHPDSLRTKSQISKGEQSIWQRRYWEHTIRDERDFQEHVDYIHFNPVRHGLVTAASKWPHSTFQKWVGRGCYEEWWGSQDMPPLPAWIGRE